MELLLVFAALLFISAIVYCKGYNHNSRFTFRAGKSSAPEDTLKRRWKNPGRKHKWQGYSYGNIKGNGKIPKGGKAVWTVPQVQKKGWGASSRVVVETPRGNQYYARPGDDIDVTDELIDQNSFNNYAPQEFKVRKSNRRGKLNIIGDPQLDVYKPSEF